MRHRLRICSLILCLLLTVTCLGACGSSGKMSRDTLLQIGDETFSRQEAMVFLLSQHSIYAGEYGDRIWEVQLSDGSFESYVRKAMLDYLERLFLADCAAKAEGVTLRQETIVRGTYSDSFDTLVFALRKDQWSPVITLLNEYALVQCLSVYEEEATAMNKAAMEKENREKQLQEAMTTYGRDITLVLNPEAWKDISLSGLAGLSLANFYDHTAGLEANY